MEATFQSKYRIAPVIQVSISDYFLTDESVKQTSKQSAKHVAPTTLFTFLMFRVIQLYYPIQKIFNCRLDLGNVVSIVTAPRIVGESITESQMVGRLFSGAARKSIVQLILIVDMLTATDLFRAPEGVRDVEGRH